MCISFFCRLFSDVGWRFSVTVFTVYGLNQGLGEGWFYALQRYYFKDVLLLTPCLSQMMTAAARTPWNIKPIYGVVSMAFPICGYHRTYYVALAGIVGGIGWGILYVTSHTTSHHGLVITVLSMFLGCYANASPDVMVDAMVLQKSKERPHIAHDLHSLCSYSASLCGAFATMSSGYLVQFVGVSESYALLFMSSMIMLVPSLLGWLGETPAHCSGINEQIDGGKTAPISNRPDGISNGRTHEMGDDFRVSGLVVSSTDTTSLVNKIKQQTFLDISIILAVSAISLAVAVVLTVGHWHIILSTIGIIVLTICVSLYVRLNIRFRLLTRVATFIFLRECLQLDTDQALFYWMTQYERGPLISSEFVGFMATLGFGAMFLGVAFYDSFLNKYTYREIFCITTILCACTPILDFILLKRVNLKIGVPDKLFILIDFAVNPMIRRLIYIPLCGLAAKVCPSGVETTLFALLMSIGNFGHDISSYTGAVLMGWLEIGEPHYDYFPSLILLKCFLRLVPLFMVPFLVPDGSPDEYVEEQLNLPTADVGNISTSSLDDSINLDVSSSPLTRGSPKNYYKTTPQHHAYVAASMYTPEPRMISE